MTEKEEILDKIWDELILGLNSGKHPFHIFTVSTVKNNKPDSRSVVLRGVDKENKSISFHTDLRSKKILQIKESENICALFYDKDSKIQLRIYGSMSMETNSLLIKEKWNSSKEMSKLCYLNKISPGEVINEPKDYLYGKEELNNIELGIKNFSIINIKISQIDWLSLNHEGHQRMLINYTSNNKIEFDWVAP
tara:strand:- start:72 stop:650 length:579 start_codon:yes stop_codon:yes gene_type:complete